MPYTNIEDRQACWRRWKKRNKKTHKDRSRIQNQACQEHPERQQCSIEGCNGLGERHHEDYSKPKEITWLCKYHHEEIHHSEIRLCSITKCDRKHMAKGLCHLHYKQKRRKEGVAGNRA